MFVNSPVLVVSSKTHLGLELFGQTIKTPLLWDFFRESSLLRIDLLLFDVNSLIQTTNELSFLLSGSVFKDILDESGQVKLGLFSFCTRYIEVS